MIESVEQEGKEKKQEWPQKISELNNSLYGSVIHWECALEEEEVRGMKVI